jgi:hypothetical protein
MSELFNTLEYRIEKYRVDKFLGIKKIVWAASGIMLVLMVPFYFTGVLIAKYSIHNASTQRVIRRSEVQPKYTIEEGPTLTYSSGTRGFYSIINNRNNSETSSIGYYPWVYNWVLEDSTNNILEKGTKVSYMLPNTEFYVIGPVTEKPALRYKIETDIVKSVPVSFSIQSSQYKEVPTITVINRKQPTLSADNSDSITLGFTLRNATSYNIGAVDAFFTIRNLDSKIIGVGQYTLTNLKAGEIQPVTLTYPNPDLGTNTNIEVLPLVNYLDEENLVLSF